MGTRRFTSFTVTIAVRNRVHDLMTQCAVHAWHDRPHYNKHFGTPGVPDVLSSELPISICLAWGELDWGQ